MDETLERKLLISEILVLEESVMGGGSTSVDFPSDAAFFEALSLSELKAVKSRFERLVRSLGGARR